MKLFVALLLAGAFLAVDAAGAPWSYEAGASDGPTNWGSIPGYEACGNGTRQTPINIVKSNTTYMKYPTLMFSNVVGNTTFTLTNNGHGVPGIRKANSPSPMLSGGPLNGTYTVYNYQMHFGNSTYVASEHAFDGKRTTGELHVVTYKSSFGSLAAAAASGESDALSVVGILFQAVPTVADQPTNTILDQTIQSAQSLMYNGNSKDISFRFSDLVSNTHLNNYYTYDGSLTTPACNEIVLWLVLDRMVYVTNAQMDSLMNLRSGTTNTSYPLFGNDRPLQSLNGRTVMSSFMQSASTTSASTASASTTSASTTSASTTSASLLLAPSAVFTLLCALLLSIYVM